jgi:hypothetical protein
MYVLVFDLSLVVANTVPWHSASSLPTIPSGNTLDSIRDYARSLLASLPEPIRDDDEVKRASGKAKMTLEGSSSSANDESMKNGVASHGGSKMSNGNGATTVDNDDASRWHPNGAEELKRVENDREKVDEGGLTGCREAVEILTRNPKKCKIDQNLPAPIRSFR